MRQAGYEFDLPEKPLAADLRRQLWAQDLQCDVSVMLHIACAEDQCHASAPDLLGDGIPVGKFLAESVQ